MNILGPEKEELAHVDNVGHVVVGTIPPVTNKNVKNTGKKGMGVYQGTESSELVFLMRGLQEDVGICIAVKVVESVDVDAEKSLGGMSGRNKVSLGILCGPGKKGKCGAVNGKKAEFRVFIKGGDRGSPEIECMEKSLHCVRLELGFLLNESGRRGGV